MTNPKSLPDAVERVRRWLGEPDRFEIQFAHDVRALLSQLDKLETEKATAESYACILIEEKRAAQASNASLAGALRETLAFAREAVQAAGCAFHGWPDAERKAVALLSTLSGEAAADNNPETVFTPEQKRRALALLDPCMELEDLDAARTAHRAAPTGPSVEAIAAVEARLKELLDSVDAMVGALPDAVVEQRAGEIERVVEALGACSIQELDALALSFPPAADNNRKGAETEEWAAIPPGLRFGRRLTADAVEALEPGTLLRFHSPDPWFDHSGDMPSYGQIVRFTGKVSRTFPLVGDHLEVQALDGRVYPGGGWVFRLFQFVGDPTLSALAASPTPSKADVGALVEDARRYRYLRDRDAGPPEHTPPGLFIGRVPENLILTGEDADAAIDAFRASHDGGL